LVAGGVLGPPAFGRGVSAPGPGPERLGPGGGVVAGGRSGSGGAGVAGGSGGVEAGELGLGPVAGGGGEPPPCTAGPSSGTVSTCWESDGGGTIQPSVNPTPRRRSSRSRARPARPRDSGPLTR